MRHSVKVRDLKKYRKKVENIALQQHPSSTLGANTNRCIAIKINGIQNDKNKAIHKIVRMSGGGLYIPSGHQHGNIVLPWAGLTPALPYPFNNCAEAKVYFAILEIHEDPSEYRITSYTPDNRVNPPCANCAQWVYATFGEVVDR